MSDELNAHPQLTQPVLQTWANVEASAPGQLNLPGMIALPTVAERAYLLLVNEYHDGLTALEPGTFWVPETLREIGYACLLLAVEYGTHFTEIAREQHRQRRRAGIRWLHQDRGSGGWIEALTWRLAERGMSGPGYTGEAEEDLLCQLAAPGSNFRMACMELAWFARPLLPSAEAIPPLLKNVADTLGYWWEALGLSFEFAGSCEAWEQHAAAFEPEDFADQFSQRIAWAKERGPGLARFDFLCTERRVRRRMEKAIFSSVLAPLGERRAANREA